VIVVETPARQQARPESSIDFPIAQKSVTGQYRTACRRRRWQHHTSSIPDPGPISTEWEPLKFRSPETDINLIVLVIDLTRLAEKSAA
jgi:hypothetical protein